MSNVGPFLQAPIARKVSRYTDQFPMYATQYIRNDGGRFVTLDTGTGTYKLSISTSAQVDGWLDTCYTESLTTNPSLATPVTTDSTSGNTILFGTKDVYSPDSAVWMGVGSGTAATTNLDQLYDLATTGSTTSIKQYVNLSGTTYKVVKVIDVDLVNNLVKVVGVQKSA